MRTKDLSKVELGDLIGQGSTCRAYQGEKEDSAGEITPVIIKEFYSEGSEEERQRKKKQFITNFRNQKNLSNTDVMNIIVKPIELIKYEDKLYSINEMNIGEELKIEKYVTIEERINIAKQVTKTMKILEDNGYIFMDFKPENMLYLQDLGGIKIFDTDSIMDGDSFENHQGDFYTNAKYRSPELGRTITGSRSMRKKLNFPKVHAYSLGIFYSELFMNGYNREECEEMCAQNIIKNWEVTEGVGEQIYSLIRGATYKLPSERIESSAKCLEILDKIDASINYEKMEYEIENKNVDYFFTSYNFIEEHPLFHFISKQDGQEVIDVVLVGKHESRRYFLDAIITCGQMLNAKLKITLASDDSEFFWDWYTSEERNRELLYAIELKTSNKEVSSYDKTLIDRPLAQIQLQKNIDTIYRGTQEMEGKYVLLLNTDFEEDLKFLQEHYEEWGGKKYFFGYLTNTENTISSTNCHPISVYKRLAEYNQDICEKRLYQIGLGIHQYYYQGKEKKTEYEIHEIEESYRRSTYSMQSSQRTAVHMRYKLYSVGINIDDGDAIEQFKERVLDLKSEVVRGNMQKLSYLEHRSWVAYMLVNGSRRLAIEELEKHVKNLDVFSWKRKIKKNAWLHPCLVPTNIAMHDEVLDWNMDWKQVDDPLNQVSIALHQFARDKALGLRDHIDYLVKRVRERTEDADEKDLLESIVRSINECYKFFPNANNDYQHALKAWKQYSKEVKDEYKLECMLSIEKYMEPMISALRKDDFKKLDSDILYALPEILSMNKI